MKNNNILTIKLFFLSAFFAAALFLNMGLAEMAKMGKASVDGRFAPETMDSLCNGQSYLILGLAGCQMVKSVIEISEKTVIIPPGQSR